MFKGECPLIDLRIKYRPFEVVPNTLIVFMLSMEPIKLMVFLAKPTGQRKISTRLERSKIFFFLFFLFTLETRTQNHTLIPYQIRYRFGDAELQVNSYSSQWLRKWNFRAMLHIIFLAGKKVLWAYKIRHEAR